MKSKELDNLFEKARNQQPKLDFEKCSGKLLDTINSGATTSTLAKHTFLNIKNMIIMISAVAVITAVLLGLLPNSSTTNTSNDTLLVGEETQIEMSGNDTQQTKELCIERINISEQTVQKITLTYPKDNVQTPVIIDTIEYRDTVKYLKFVPAERNASLDLAPVYKFPILTKEEIRKNQKRKSKMLRQITRMDKRKYAYIPRGTINLETGEASVDAFYMQTTEVTNLEYRTFLTDLLIQNRKTEFLAALPDEEQWKLPSGNRTIIQKPMQEMYFSHPAYDEFPVTTLSRESVNIYCKWLTDEAIKYDSKRNRFPGSDVRLPTDMEWMHAAYGGSKNQELYPWNTNSVRNESGRYLANYAPVVNDTIRWTYDGGFFTVPVESYEPNNFGLYCMSGNLSEMVINFNSQAPETKGGNFTSPKEEIMITSNDLFRGVTSANCRIGFRVVFSFLTK